MRFFLCLLITVAGCSNTGKGVGADTDIDSSTVDDDADGYMLDVDCDDENPDVYPGAPELCDETTEHVQHRTRRSVGCY